MRPLLLLALILSVGCSTTHKLMREANKIPTWDAVYEPTKGSEMNLAFNDLKARLMLSGITIQEIEGLADPSGGDVAGMTWRKHGIIQLESTLEINAKFEVLAHEAGHLFHSPILEYAAREVFAEIVGTQIQIHYGSKTAFWNSVKYLAAYKSGFPTVKYNKLDMDMAVKAATGQIYWRFNQPEEE